MSLTRVNPKLIKSAIGSKTTTVTLGKDDEYVELSSSGGAYTATLPPVADYLGRVMVLIKTTADFNLITIDGDGSETINGATTTTLATQWECIHIIATSSGWRVIRREIPSDPGADIDYTISAGFGTLVASSDVENLYRDKDRLKGSLHFQGGTLAASAAYITLTDLNIDTSKLLADGKGELGTFKYCVTLSSATFNDRNGVFISDGSNTDRLVCSRSVGTGLYASANGTALGGGAEYMIAQLDFPVSGWSA
jgi:hypothetical protein